MTAAQDALNARGRMKNGNTRRWKLDTISINSEFFWGIRFMTDIGAVFANLADSGEQP